MKYTQEEIKLIKTRMAEGCSTKKIAEELGRNANSLRSKIHYSGLRDEKLLKSWTLEELKILKTLTEKKIQDTEISRILGRSLSSVVHKRNKMQYKKHCKLRQSCKDFVRGNLDKSIEFLVANTELTFEQANRLKFKYKRELRGYAKQKRFLTDVEVEHVIELKNDGYKLITIAEFYGCSSTTITNSIRRYREVK